MMTMHFRSGRLSIAASLVLGALLLAACGQKGPLWVSGHGKDTAWPMKPAGTDAAPPPATPAAGAPAAPEASTRNSQDAR